nr:ATP-binding protein [Candidatus Neomarinimicrobiota bacterium]
HEIRNPLNAIKILSQRIKKEFQPKSDELEYHEMTKTMVSEIDRINKILEDYLSYSRPIPLKNEKFDIRKMMDEIESLYGEATKIKGIHLDINVSDKITINGDKQYLKQAIANLIKNAIEASTKNDKITLFAAETAKNVIINISDTGCGISKDNLTKIYDLFYSTKDMGTGLGLAITHKIINDHLGMLEVESELEQGTTFTITLPKENV